MTDAADRLLAMDAHEFVSLTTFRRSGDGVPTAVWIARDGDALVITTAASTGKVKRLRNDPRVTLRPCSRTGAVADDAPTVGGRAEIVTDAERISQYADALRRKYKLQYRLIDGLGKLRRSRAQRVILRITAS